MAQTTETLEKITLDIPTLYSEIKLSKDNIEFIKKALNEQDGNVVLIKLKESSLLVMGRIRIDPRDTDCYYFQKPYLSDIIIEKRLWYNDLTSLFEGVGPNKIEREFVLRK